MHHIKMSGKLRHKLSLDIGDWLLFNTKHGRVSLMVSQTSNEDVLEYGDFKALVSEDCIIVEEGVGEEVNIRHHDLTVGADPEFFFVSKTGRIVEGYTLFDKDGELGSDGDLGEMRPDFALSPDQVTENLYNIIKTIPRRISGDITPIATSWYNGLCCGFHIHFGMPAEIMTFAAENTDAFLKSTMHVMDYMVGIPAHSVDPDDNRRLSTNYGNPSDFRMSMRTVEYRTPGGYHLRSRKSANSLLCLGFSVMDTLIKDCEITSDGWADMSKISDYRYFMDRYGIPEYEYTNQVMKSRDKDDLKVESEKVARILLEMNSDYIGDVTFETVNSTNMYEGWL
jgi:hypothetical protein